MKGIHYPQHGQPDEVLRLIELPEPIAGPGQLVVQVEASPVDPADLLAIRGLYALLPSLPACPGMEGCGRVLASRHPTYREGDRVLLPMRSGAWCERVAVDGEACHPLPEGDAVQLCMLRINPPTATLLLEGVEPGQWVVQDPGSSSVGQLVVQEARRRGIRTLNVVRRPERAERLAALGADRVVEKLQRGLPKAVRALDGMGGVATERLARCVQPGGEVICYGAVSRQPAQLSVTQSIFRDIRLRGFWLYRWNGENPERASELLTERGRDLATGALQIEIANTFALEDWRAALALAQSPERCGKVVFCPGGSPD